MGWITGLTSLPALACGAMMSSMALAGLFGWPRSQHATVDRDHHVDSTDQLEGSSR